MIGRLANSIVGVAGAASGSQFPAFYQQYVLVLRGLLTKAERDVEPLREYTLRAGRTLDELLADLERTNSEFLRTLGEGARRDLSDSLIYREAYDALSAANAYEKPLVFGRHFDPDIAQLTAGIFQPAMPLSLEGGIYAGVGLLAGLILLAGGERSTKGLYRRATRRRQSQAS